MGNTAAGRWSVVDGNSYRWYRQQLWKEDGKGLTLQEAFEHSMEVRLVERFAPDALQRAVDETDDLSRLHYNLDRVLQTLTFREREILKLLFGIGDGYTYTMKEIGRLFNITGERVGQIVAKGIRKLQNPVRARKLRPAYLAMYPGLDE